MPTTMWTVVRQGGAGSAEALETLCRLYWKPIHSYLCRCGVQPADADDVTQEFLLHLQERNRLARPQPELGRFRSYLLKALRNFLSDWWAKHPSHNFVPLPPDDEEVKGPIRVGTGPLPPDREFDRNFTLTVIEQALNALRSEYTANGQAERFEVLAELLPGKCRGLSQADVAARLGLNEGAVAKAVHDLRKKFGKAYWKIVAMTVDSYEDIDDEIKHHLKTLGG